MQLQAKVPQLHANLTRCAIDDTHFERYVQQSSQTCLCLQEADPRRVVVAVRKEGESRRLDNAAELTSHLSQTGYNVTQVTFGSLPFKQQIELMSNAKVLIGVHGSDLVSFLFMPFRAVVIEVLPLVMGTPLFNPELANQARNYGKIHRQYFSPYNATLVTDPNTGQPIDARPVHLANLVRVHVPDLVVTMQGLIQTSDAMMWYGLIYGPSAPGELSVCRYDRPVPHGLLYGCYDSNC